MVACVSIKYCESIDYNNNTNSSSSKEISLDTERKYLWIHTERNYLCIQKGNIVGYRNTKVIDYNNRYK